MIHQVAAAQGISVANRRPGEEPTEGVEGEAVVYAPAVPGLEQKPFAALLKAGRTDFASPRPDLRDKVGSRLALVATSIRRLPSGPDEPQKNARIDLRATR